MKKRSEEQWRALFAEQETSSLSAAIFCKQNDLCPKYFSLRRKQLMMRAGEEEAGFVQAQVKPVETREVPGVMAASLTIQCNKGLLVFGALPPPGWLVQLLKDLA